MLVKLAVIGAVVLNAVWICAILLSVYLALFST